MSKETTYRCDVCGTIIKPSYELEIFDGFTRNFIEVGDNRGKPTQIITSFTARQNGKDMPIGLVTLKSEYTICETCAIETFLDRIEYSYLKKWQNKKGEMYGR